ncbi:MAG TPA: Lrp/AsnC ligand binding domain-containing protein [Tenuifilaceae bacterium]|nr:Lrp/AsnC ligand binding domain-containing protein [Tenuifilaceae bacterium]HOZ13689.1 Lrp/AsnC ligand binding domain-containing protein [Tenuifilaceae bacterium]HPI44727.1 Lrp/AsnC ligand binding domain-containing protein [Tenuifilaceae bacterium]HPN21814.1 Lrp/AsnC ligand binding domain-containing protein [Tenuifilaceae bacterium]
MSEKFKVDAIDQKILSYLVKNARMPFLEIARECGISGAAIHQRVKKMEDADIIAGSRMIVKPKALGFDVCAFVGVQLVSTNQYVGVIDALKLMPEVVECHFITGEFALLLKLFCRDNEHLMDVLVNTIQNIQGISRTETFISLDQAIERPVYVKDKSVVK